MTYHEKPTAVASKRRVRIPALLLSLAAGLPAAAGEIRLPAILGDNMVLQAGKLIPIWGTAGPDEEITVRLGEAKVSAHADAGGRFQARLPAQSPGGPVEVTIAGSSGTSRTIKNVLIGEVWICSGQSNMEWPLKVSNGGEEAIAAADHPTLRLFTVSKAVSEKPEGDCKGTWAASSPQTAPGFSAVGYFFGLELLRELKVPVGLVNTSWGGTPAESWTSSRALGAEASLKPLLDRWEKTLAEKPEEKGSPFRPANIYNGMIAPLVPLAICGAIWYQGESNADRAGEYRTLFPAMIRNWRADFGQGDFPFLFVQLANFMERKSEPGDSAWAELRDAQLHTLRTVPGTGMAVIIDIGEAKDIHPHNKLDVGKRLARWALSAEHQKDLVRSGPLFASMKREGDRIQLSFDHAQSGLKAAEGGSLKGFAVAGEDRKWVWAEAKIEGGQVVVSSPSVKGPVAVRYGWADNPECNLQNAAGLPASPFRTDDWPPATEGKR
jgi:sialate O-acetylesterase